MNEEELKQGLESEPEEKRKDTPSDSPVPDWKDETGEASYDNGTERLLVMPQRDLVVFNEITGKGR